MDTFLTIRKIRQEYEDHLKAIHPDWSIATRKTRVSRAFYLYSHGMVPSFWAVLKSQENLDQAKETLRIHFKNLYPNDGTRKLSAYFRALVSLKDYLDKQGGVQAVIGLEYNAEHFLYQQVKLVYEERILIEQEVVLLTDEEEQALPQGAIELLKESLPFLSEIDLSALVNWCLALMTHTPFLFTPSKSQKSFYGLLLFFLERLEEDYGRERLAQALWTLQKSLHQSYIQFHHDMIDLRLSLQQFSNRYKINIRFDEEILKPDFQSDFPIFSSLDSSLEENSFSNPLSSFASSLFNRIDFSLDEKLLLAQDDLAKEEQENAVLPTVRSPYLQEEFEREVFLSPEQSQTLCKLLKRKKNLILQGPPGTGKTYLARRLAYLMLQEKNEDLICSVQFHANYTYEDFIMGYRPTKTGFALRPGVFYTFCEKARHDPRDHFFIIDEMNRGHVAKIFGELFSLLEIDKRGQALPLLYTQEPFSIPQNVYLIGMMNTADRTLSTLDYALRRRFAFYDLHPAFSSFGFKAYQKSLNNPKFDRLVKEVEALNEEIQEDDTLGAGFQIGHSYLMSDEVDDSFLESVVDFELLSLLKEYWLDEPERIEYWSQRLHQAIL